MFAVSGSSEFASTLQNSLISAARDDNFNPFGHSHDSGWGGVWYSEKDQNYYRTTAAIFNDSSAPKFFSGAERLAGISHARLAASGEPIRGAFDSHPFSTHVGDKLVYISHNGHIDKYKIADLAGVENPREVNDTEVFTFLLERVRGATVMERIQSAIDRVHELDAMKGALNLMILSVGRSRGDVEIYYYHDFPDQDSDKELYYSFYVARQDGSAAVMSSTVACKGGLVNERGEITEGGVSKCPMRRLEML